MFFIDPTAACNVCISLRVLERQGGGRDYDVYIGMRLYQKGGKRLRYCYKSQQRGPQSSYTPAREIFMALELKPEPTPLTLMCSTYDPDEEATFILTVASDKPLKHVSPDGTIEMIGDTVPAA
jgi:hypothetical protein